VMRSFVDQLEMPLPSVSVEAAQGAAARLGRAGAAADDALEKIESVVTPSWVGAGNAEWVQARGRMGGHVDSVSAVASAAARMVAAYASTMAEVLGEMSLARREWADAQGLQRLAVAASGGVPAGSLEAGMAAWARYDRAMAAYRDAVVTAAAGLEALQDQVYGRPISVGEHAGDFVAGLWEESVAGPVAVIATSATEAARDPLSWWAVRAGARRAALGGDVDPRRAALGGDVDPRPALERAAGVPEFKAGRYGAGVAVLASNAVPTRALQALASAVEHPFARNMADPAAPRPRPQTVVEMLAGVDLGRHEHHDLGHAIRRHVDVDDAYLKDRLINGTLEDNATRGRIPAAASAWDDLETAERSITHALLAKEGMLRAMAAGTIKPGPITVHLPKPAGRVMTGAEPDFTTQPGQRAVIFFARDGDRFFIKTAYPKVKEQP